MDSRSRSEHPEIGNSEYLYIRSIYIIPAQVYSPSGKLGLAQRDRRRYVRLRRVDVDLAKKRACLDLTPTWAHGTIGSEDPGAAACSGEER